MATKEEALVLGPCGFRLSHDVYGAILLLIAAICSSIGSTMCDVAESEGLSSSALLLYASFTQLGGALLVDAYFRYVGYAQGVHWFVFIDIFKPKQWNKFVTIKHFSLWFILQCVLSYAYNVAWFASFVFVYDIGDAMAIADCFPVLIPLFGLCIPTGDDWKHRYFVCITLIFFAVVLLTKPAFIFGGGVAMDTTQTIGCLLAFLSAVIFALALISTVMVKKLSYADLCRHRNEMEIESDNEETPLRQQPEATERKIDYIIHHDMALAVLTVEYIAVAIILQCFLFCPLSLISDSWLWSQFVLFYPNATSKSIRYALGSSIFAALDMGFYIYGVLKVNNAPLASIVDISDVFFTYLLSYIWLNTALDAYSAVGSTLIIVGILFSLCPWNRHAKIPDSF